MDRRPGGGAPAVRDEPAAGIGSTAIRIRRASAIDAAATADVFLASFHATYAFPLAHSDGDVRRWIRETVVPEQETWVAEEGEAIVGLLVVAPGWVEQLY